MRSAAVDTLRSRSLTEAAEAHGRYAVRNGRRLVYAAAGSSGLMAMADALELPGTFGLPPSGTIASAHGRWDAQAGWLLPGDVEDDIGEGAEAAARSRSAPSDARYRLERQWLNALRLGGRPPGTTETCKRRSSASPIDAEAPLFDHADMAICLPTPPEVVAGSTRMGAGTAQKTALNIMSTLMGIQLGPCS